MAAGLLYSTVCCILVIACVRPVCRILGGSGLALQYSLPTVKLSLFYEREIPDCDEYIDGVCQVNNGGERKFTINRGTRACTAQFNSIQLKNVRRPDRGKNEELVTEHKYAFVFYCSVHICEQQIPLRVCRCLCLCVPLTSCVVSVSVSLTSCVVSVCHSRRMWSLCLCHSRRVWSVCVSDVASKFSLCAVKI